MEAHLLRCSVVEQQNHLRIAKLVVKSNNKQAKWSVQLLEIDANEEQLTEYNSKLRAVEDKRKRASKMVTMLTENLKQIRLEEVRAEIREAEKELAEEELEAAKKKAEKKAAKKAKAARQKSKAAKEVASAAAEKSETERRSRIQEERAAD